MKNLKDICNVNIPNSLHSLYEGSLSSNKLDESSILADVEDTIKYGNKIIDYSKLINILNAKSKQEFYLAYNTLYNIISNEKEPVKTINQREYHGNKIGNVYKSKGIFIEFRNVADKCIKIGTSKKSIYIEYDNILNKTLVYDSYGFNEVYYALSDRTFELPKHMEADYKLLAKQSR
jgi:hypothetical protein